MTVEFEDLSAEQRRVVDCTDSDVLVLGGAGTGKTVTALWTANKEIERQDARDDRPNQARVLILTFSRTAVSRVLERAGGILPARIHARVEVSTFHGLAFRIVNNFGRYSTGESEPIRIQSSAESRLFGRAPGSVGYGSLIPEALKVLQIPRISALYSHRWSLVICDEFQDTSDEQWEILQLLGQSARLLMLGDANQMIYQWLPGVGPHRLSAARLRSPLEVPLPRASHRDPTQVIPAAAEAILQGDYHHNDVANAVTTRRLRIFSPVHADSGARAILWQISEQRKRGSNGIGVYVRENSFVHEVCQELAVAGVQHTMVGIPESRAHALEAQLTIMQACAGEASWADVCRELALYLVSVTRGKVPPAANLLAAGHAPTPTQAAKMDELHRLITGGELLGLQCYFELARSCWRNLGYTVGQRSWATAASSLAPYVVTATRRNFSSLSEARAGVNSIRSALLLSEDHEDDDLVQVMTMNQTKGRESDSTIVWCRGDDYFGSYHDWSQNGRRLLYVALTRAKNEISILLAPDAHSLWSPLSRFAVNPPNF
jgi:DNA helicase-2/ATP-dependent DNA helicase PcrA